MAGRDHFDHVVIGAGTAGSVVASRLTERDGCRVHVLEAGALDTTPTNESIPPLGVFKLWNSGYDWRDQTVPQDQIGGREIVIASGRVVGGSSAISFMFWCRGASADYDRWAQEGMTGWAWEDVLPSFRRAEDAERGESDAHGRGGPIAVSASSSISPASLAFVTACIEHGLALNKDFTSGDSSGAGFIDSSIRRGVRSSTRDYIIPALERPNLSIEVGVRVHRILFENRRVVGVEYVDGSGQLTTVSTDSVVLSAGAIRSPQILMLSGIGPAQHLAELGIDVVADLPGVGANLQDHPTLPVIWPLLKGRTWADTQDPACMAEWIERKTGPLAQIAEVTAYFRAGGAAGPPDFQVVPVPTDYLGQNRRALSCVMNLLTPASRGTLRLQSSDPAAMPLIDPRYLTEASDREALVAGLREVLKIGASPAFRTYIGEEAFDLRADVDFDEMLAYVRRTMSSHAHPVGTCRAGSDGMSVVDPQLRVHGLEGLRIIDNSVMPVITRAPTQAPAVLIGERGSELMIQHG